MKSKLTILASMFIATNALSQVHLPDSDTTIFHDMWNTFYSHKDYTYFAPLPFTSVNGKPPQFSELFEAQLALPFPLFIGRDHQRLKTRASGLFVIPKNMSRMYLSDDEGKSESSFPVRPLNFNPTLSYVHFIQKGKYTNKCSDTYIGRKSHNYSYYFIDLAHFSNGQSDSAIRTGADHNNHYTGNFSTNYLKVGLNFSSIGDRSAIWFTHSYFYQWDMNLFGVFGYDDNQLKRYGKHRVGGMFQLQSEAYNIHRKRNNVKRYKCKLDGGYDARNRVKDFSDWYFTWQLRAEPTFIAGNLDNYFRRDKERLSMKFSAAIYPLNWRSLGMLVQYYYGRDYYNIRYDQKMSRFQIAFVVDPNKFVPHNKDVFYRDEP